jgi:glycerate kinase
MNIAGAKFQPGFELVAGHADLNQHLRNVDLVVTGEGSIDRTTAMGKGCGEMARLCRTHWLPCIALGGRVVRTEIKRMFAQAEGLTELTTPAEAMRRLAFWLRRLAEKTAANLVCKPRLRR